jgi:2-methylcitrate dehydratase PrpD
MKYCLATALLDGPPGLAKFTDPEVNRAEVQDLLRRIEVRTEPSWPTSHADGRFRTRVTARLADGRTLSAEREFPPGSPQRPLSRAELEQKFVDCATPVLGAARAREALAALDGLAERARAADVLELTAAD